MDPGGGGRTWGRHGSSGGAAKLLWLGSKAALVGRRELGKRGTGRARERRRGARGELELYGAAAGSEPRGGGVAGASHGERRG